jgi:hypothetical protein
VVTLRLATAPHPVGGEAARRAAKTELSHAEYHRDEPDILSRLVHWIGRQLDRLLGGTGPTHAVLLLGLVAIAVALVFAVRAGIPGRRVRSRVGVDADPLAPVPARDHRRLARQFAAEGRRAEALREWLRATVQTIEDRGVLPPRPGRTGAAVAREAGPLLPSAAADLAAATTAFDEVWFGGRDATDADVAHAEAAASAVLSARVGTGGSVPAGLAVPQ